MNKLNDQISQDLRLHLDNHLKSLPNDFIEIFEYATFPTGKLFRSNLVWRFYCDLNKLNIDKIKTSDHPNVQYLSSAVEIHHAYTLVHDDLPCMDDDDYRRNKPSTHKKYNEWKALLVGDGLLNLSYELLATIQHHEAPRLVSMMAKLCGPEGLILGQYLDLLQDNEKFNFQNILKIHELKTANLFITCLLGASILSNCENKKNESIRNIGKSIGIAFQLIDDLTELCEAQISSHEKEINPWCHDYDGTKDYFKSLIKQMKTEVYEYKSLAEMINIYIEVTAAKVIKNKSTIENHLGSDLSPIITELQIVNEI